MGFESFNKSRNDKKRPVNVRLRDAIGAALFGGALSANPAADPAPPQYSGIASESVPSINVEDRRPGHVREAKGLESPVGMLRQAIDRAQARYPAPISPALSADIDAAVERIKAQDAANHAVIQDFLNSEPQGFGTQEKRIAESKKRKRSHE